MESCMMLVQVRHQTRILAGMASVEELNPCLHLTSVMPVSVKRGLELQDGRVGRSGDVVITS